MPSFALPVNGRDRTVDVPADTPLLWVLRDALELVGTKYGCGMGQCGACTVHLNGVPARSCQVPISTIAGAQITTIEGLSADPSHPLQRAWIEHDVRSQRRVAAGDHDHARPRRANQFRRLSAPAHRPSPGR